MYHKIKELCGKKYKVNKTGRFALIEVLTLQCLAATRYAA
jgi:hypothetical protein